MYKLAYKEDLTVNGFYKEGIHSNMPNPNIDITNDLWQYLLQLGEFRLTDVPTKDFYSIEDKDFFEKVISEVTEEEESQPTLDDRLSILEQENADLMFTLMINGVI